MLSLFLIIILILLFSGLIIRLTLKQFESKVRYVLLAWIILVTSLFIFFVIFIYNLG